MWELQFLDIGGDGLTSKKVTNVDSLPEAEVMAALECARHLGVQVIDLRHDKDLVYECRLNGRECGFVVIRTL